MKHYIFTTFKLISLLSAYLLTAFIQYGHASPNIGVNAQTLPKGILFFSERFFYAEYIGKYNEDFQEYVQLGADEEYKSFMTLTTLAYGFTDKFTLAVNAWYIDSKIETDAVSQQDSGLGDLYAYGKYKVYSVEKEPASGISLLAGIRLPTGDDEQAPELRLGDGTTDYGLGVAGTKSWGRLTNSLLAARWFSSGDAADAWDIRTSTEYALIKKKLNLLLEFKYDYFLGKNEHLLVVAPGIQYIPKFPLSLYASCKFPLSAEGYYKYDQQFVVAASFALPVF